MSSGFQNEGAAGRKDVETSKFYTLLDTNKNASEADIKKAYKRVALKTHPDRGGDPEKFRAITRAYEVLSDAEQRARYDRFGEEAVLPDRMDVFPFPDMFFLPSSNRRRKTKSLVQPLNLTLEQIYQGQTQKMPVTRQVLDPTSVRSCGSCEGQGVKTRVERVEPFPHMQILRSQCDACQGQGKSFKTTQQQEVLEVNIQKGVLDGKKIVFTEKADEHPDADTGDVVFVVKEQRHRVFKRRGADLFVEKTISLSEALCGFTLELEHLDGRKLMIRSAPGDVVKPIQGFDPLEGHETKMQREVIEDADSGLDTAEATADETLKSCETQKGADGVVTDGQRALSKHREETPANTCKGSMYSDQTAFNPRVMKAVRGEGLPTFKNPLQHGNLFLILDIEFPDFLPQEARQKLCQLLPPLERTWEEDSSAELHQVVQMDPVQSYNSNKVNMSAGEEDEDEDGPGGNGAKCKQM